MAALDGSAAAGGHAGVAEAARAMAGRPAETYFRTVEGHQAYERSFSGYQRMAEHFGQSDPLLRELKAVRASAAKALEAKP